MRTEAELTKEAYEETVLAREQAFKSSVKNHIAGILNTQAAISKLAIELAEKQTAFKALKLEPVDTALFGVS